VHFPLHAGTEVLIACTNGDPDRPIILGSVANPATQSPVTSSNASQHTVRTFAGNELMMDDMSDSEKINLHTKDQKNFLSLDANSDGHLVALRTEEGRSEFYAKKTMSFESGDSYTLQSGNDQTITVENKHSLQTNKKDIAFNAATDIALTAKQNIKLNAEDKDISLTSGQDLIIEAGKTMSVQVRDGDSAITVDQGRLSIDSARGITILGQGGGPIQISQGGGIIEITKGGDLTIIASAVEISAATVSINGGAVSLNEGGAAPTTSSKAAPMMLAAADTGTMSDVSAGYGAVASGVAATPAVEEEDPEIEALGLNETARKAAYELKKAHPTVKFTSGYRSVDDQARAMSKNVVEKRDYIKSTHKESTLRTKLQKWVDDNPTKKTQKEIQEGLMSVFNTASKIELDNFSAHMTKDAFDVQPVEKDAEAIKKTINGLKGLKLFLEKEAGMVRWHAAF
jgi:hypothetical protein